MTGPGPATGQGPGQDQVGVLVARFLRERGVDRVSGLQGGHIQPIWDQLARIGVQSGPAGADPIFIQHANR